MCVPGDSTVWPSAQRAPETVSAALPVLQPPAPHPSALPLAHFSLLQQPSQQGHPAAGDELCAAGYVHTGKRGGLDTRGHTLRHNTVKRRHVNKNPPRRQNSNRGLPPTSAHPKPGESVAGQVFK